MRYHALLVSWSDRTNETEREKSRSLKSIIKLMLFFILIHQIKIFWFTQYEPFVNDFVLHMCNGISHLTLFAISYLLAFLRQYQSAKTTLLIGFISYITFASMIWRFDVGLQNYLLLAFFVHCYLQKVPYDRSFIVISSVIFTTYMLLNTSLIVETIPLEPMIATEEHNLIAFIKLFNLLIFALSCVFYAAHISRAIDTGLHAIRQLEKHKDQLLRKLIPPFWQTTLLSKQAHKNRKISEIQFAGPEKEKLYTKQALIVLFLDICGSTSSNTHKSLTEDEKRADIYELFSLFDKSLNASGGYRVKVNGDQYIAVFGLAKTATTDGKLCPTQVIQAFHCALSLNEIAQKNKINVRQGLAKGTITHGIFDDKTPEFDIWGDTVVEAARLERKAQSNSLALNKAFIDVLLNTFHRLDKNVGLKVKRDLLSVRGELKGLGIRDYYLYKKSQKRN